MPDIIRKIFLLGICVCVSQYCFSQNNSHFILPQGVSENDFIKNTIILKIKPEYASSCKNNQIDLPQIISVFEQLGVTQLYKKFPRINSPELKYNSYGQKLADLSLIYEIEYNSLTTIEKAINNIISTALVEYAQPHYILQPLDYIPNDPLISYQYHLATIKAFSAWDTEKGDTNIVVGICDWGTDISHPDLTGNIKYNRLDTIDGIDNDNDGYIDNYFGWDMGENDYNPQNTYYHGTFVAGLSSATPDNNIGLSGTGFLCKFLPVKVCNSNNQGTMTYESIVYAVEHGCSIVNCSWGGTFYTGQYGQDVIDYASINKGALVVAACGNDNNAVPFFPASYNYVLSVASSNILDHKSSGPYGSSYGYYVDIIAPGDNVCSTDFGGVYNCYGGTSFSSPIVSGCAALLKSRFPSLTGLQIGEKLKVSADIIDTIPANFPYTDLLGSGRLNIFNAMNDTTHPSVKMFDVFIENNNHETVVNPADTIQISGDFINYLIASTPNLKVTLSSVSPYIVILDSVFNAGIIPTLGTLNNNSTPFSVKIKPNMAANEEIIFMLTFSDDNYRAVQYFSVFANKNYIDIDTNKIATSLTSDGVLGYSNHNSLQGFGFRYNNGETMLYSGGFIVGKSVSQVSDVIYNDFGGYDHDFAISTALKKVIPPVVSDFDVYGVFNDSYAGASKINIQLTQQAHAWINPPNDKFVILEYTVTNKNTSPISGIYVGLFVDWDIKNSTTNRINYDASTKMGYCYSTQGGAYTGISLISQGTPHHYAFDINGANGSIGISDGFTSSEKYFALKNNRENAGISGSGNDVADMVSSGPHTIAAGDSVKIAFALIAGDHLGDLQNSAGSAYQIYNFAGISESENNSEENFVLYQNNPNPFNEKTSISLLLKKEVNIELSYSDIKGLVTDVIYKGVLVKGLHSFQLNKNLKPGIYVYTLSGDGFYLKKKMCVIK